MARQKFIQVAKEELAFYGVEYASLQQLLAIVAGTNDTSLTGNLAAIGVRELSRMREEDLLQFDGLNKAGASRIVASFGIAEHLNRSKKSDSIVIRCPEDAARHLDYLKFKQQEEFVCIYLNTKNEVISTKTIFKGSLNASIVHPREVFKEAYRLNAASILVSHNHPSGNPSPSNEDIDVTIRLVDCGKVLGIELRDHIIIGDGKFVSMKEKGFIKK